MPDAPVVERLRAAGCVFAEQEAAMLCSAAPSSTALDALVARRVAGEPLEQVLGWAGFHGLRLVLEPGVFVPRRRSEFLVDTALGLAGARPSVVLLDLCCGCGALAAAFAASVAAEQLEVHAAGRLEVHAAGRLEVHAAGRLEVHAAGRLEVHAADVDPAAVRCARRNLPAGARVYLGPLFEPLPPSLRGRVDVLLANVPYVPTAAIALLPAEFRTYEQRAALDGGADGLDVARAVIAAAPGWLAPGGHLLIELAEEQVPAARTAMAAAGLHARVATSDDTSVLIGSLLPSPR